MKVWDRDRCLFVDKQHGLAIEQCLRLWTTVLVISQWLLKMSVFSWRLVYKALKPNHKTLKHQSAEGVKTLRTCRRQSERQEMLLHSPVPTCIQWNSSYGLWLWAKRPTMNSDASVKSAPSTLQFTTAIQLLFRSPAEKTTIRINNPSL